MRHPAGRAQAFTQGRRPRDAAQRRHAPPARSGGPTLRRSLSRFLLLRIVLPLVAVVLGALALVVLLGLTIALLATFLAAGATVLLVGAVAVTAVRRCRRRAALRRGGAPGTAPLPARPAAPPRPDLVWEHARQRFHRLRAEYAAFECDAMQVLRLPALADVSVPSTGRFVDAFAEAQALATDALPPESHAAGFVAAVDRAERAWRAARQAAERIRHSRLSPAERTTVERVIKLLTTARDSDSDPERLAAYSRARSELAKLDRAGVIHLPPTAQAALDASGKSALPA